MVKNLLQLSDQVANKYRPLKLASDCYYTSGQLTLFIWLVTNDTEEMCWEEYCEVEGIGVEPAIEKLLKIYLDKDDEFVEEVLSIGYEDITLWEAIKDLFKRCV